ncbi:MAG: hypothetical protein C0483_00605 [Pirellula sp.]|nr:hypothetical protein [Pirellula sp.]
MDVSRLLAASVTPVVLISACGLIMLALYNRLGAILSRLRAFHQQKHELLKGLNEREADDTLSLMALVDSQVEKVTRKAKVIQKGLYCLLAAASAFLLCSLFAAVAVLRPEFNVAALAMHFVGLLLFLAGLGWAIRELTLSITPLDEENAFLQTVTADHLAKLHVSKEQKPKLADAA